MGVQSPSMRDRPTFLEQLVYLLGTAALPWTLLGITPLNNFVVPFVEQAL